MSITVELVVQPTPEVHHLIGELNDVLGAVYEPHQRHGLSVEQLFEPHVRFFLARLDGIAVGCGGGALFDDYAEVKRMYTRPTVRGLGLAKALLGAVENEARLRSASVLRLETGIHQREAIGLYESVGFRPCGQFGTYATMPTKSKAASSTRKDCNHRLEAERLDASRRFSISRYSSYGCIVNGADSRRESAALGE